MKLSELKEQVKSILREKMMNEAGITRTYRAFMSLKHKVKELEEKQLEMLKQWQSEKNPTKKNSLLDMMKKSTKELQKQRSYLAKLEDNYINKMSYDDSYNESVNEGASSEEKRIAMLAVKKQAKYRNVSLSQAIQDQINALEELKRQYKGK